MKSQWIWLTLLAALATAGCYYRYLGAYELRDTTLEASKLEALSYGLAEAIAPLGYTRMPSRFADEILFERRDAPQSAFAELAGSQAHVLVAITPPDGFGDGIDIVINDAESQGETPFVAETKRIIVEFLRERYGIEAPKFRRRIYMGSRSIDPSGESTAAGRADGANVAQHERSTAGKSAPRDG